MPAKVFQNINPQSATSWLHVPRDWRRPSIDENYEILWDPSNSFGQIWPRPNPEDVMNFYDVDHYYTHGTENNHDEKKLSVEQRIQTKLSWWGDNGIEPNRDWWERVLSRNNMRILEVGCGNGSNLSIFKSLGHEVVGVEPDTAALEVAREKGHNVFQGTAESLPQEINQECFDAIVFMHVLEHCIDPFVAVKNATSLLSKDGLFIAEVPNNDCLGAKRFGEIWYWLDVPRHLNFFTSKSLRKLILAAGLNTDSIYFRGYCRQFNADWKKSQAHILGVMDLKCHERIKVLSYWNYLFETIFAQHEKKYDSVRIVAAL